MLCFQWSHQQTQQSFAKFNRAETSRINIFDLNTENDDCTSDALMTPTTTSWLDFSQNREGGACDKD